MPARTRIACALALCAALPLAALADTLVTPDGTVVITPRAVQVQPQAPLTTVTPVVPAYPAHPYSTYPDATPTDRAVVVPAAPLSHDDYLREMARRWDASDIAGMGLTPNEMSNLTGHVDSNAMAPITGTGVSPANMGPGNSRGQ
jgi:hypothetical protein